MLALAECMMMGASGRAVARKYVHDDVTTCVGVVDTATKTSKCYRGLMNS